MITAFNIYISIMSPGAALATYINEIEVDELYLNPDPLHLNNEREIDSCVVLCFEERDNPDDYESIDTRIFVSYDHESKSYVINGRRLDVFSKSGRNRTNFKPFMFCVKESADVAEFIYTIFNKKNMMSYTLYNYNNLPEDACELTYDFMESNMDREYEISAFDNVGIKKAIIKRVVRMARHMFN